MKTIQQDLECNNLSLNEAKLTWLRIVHSGDWCLRSALCTPEMKCHKLIIFVCVI